MRRLLGGSACAFERLVFVFFDGGGTVVRVRGQREAEQGAVEHRHVGALSRRGHQVCGIAEQRDAWPRRPGQADRELGDRPWQDAAVAVALRRQGLLVAEHPVVAASDHRREVGVGGRITELVKKHAPRNGRPPGRTDAGRARRRYSTSSGVGARPG